MLSRGSAIAIVVIGLVLTTAGILIGIHIHKSDVKPGPQPNCPKPGPQPNCPKPNCPKPGPQPNCLKPTFPCACATNSGGSYGTYGQCFPGAKGGNKDLPFTDLLCTNWSDTELFMPGGEQVKFARNPHPDR